ncbi:MAG: IS200/IS605 family transposase, partial [Anaerolineae bacterium]|nr:IS200/IS605 family transposase [Anaerolineae bacterium]
HLTKKDARPEQVPPEWLHDSAAAASQFANLTVSEPAQAAMVTRAGEVWAFSTGLTDAAAQELARTVVEYWEGERGDLARFVKLDQTGEEHMMYAVSLGEDFLLVVLFEASAPFSRLRSIAAGMARALEQADPVEPAPFIEDDSPVEPASDPAPPFEHGPEEAADASQPLLEDVPPSVPEDWKPRSPYIPAEDREAEQDFPPSIETAPPPPQFIELPPEEETGEFIETDPAYQPGKISSSIPDVQADTIEQKRDTLIEYSSDTVASKPDKNGRVIKVEPVSPALYHLSYACVLVPRFPHHHLTGPFAEHLSTWVTQLCLAFGWRLEHLSIRPDYLQWIVNLPPSSSPGHLMRIIRQHTSRRLFVQYPRFEQDNPSGDFWAPGYFILSSDQPPPADLVQEFIQQTRYRQGISRTG